VRNNAQARITVSSVELKLARRLGMRYNALSNDEYGFNMTAPSIAQQLKFHRQQRQWSLDKTAQATGVSKAMLGQIERGESSPTLATVWKIASGLEISASELMELERPAGVHSADALRHKPTTDEMWVATLFPFDTTTGFEMFELTLNPGFERMSEPHNAGVMEHVVVVAGSIDLWIGDQWQTLRQGEAVKFAADQTHGYRNLSDQPGVIHDVIYYPGRRK